MFKRLLIVVCEVGSGIGRIGGVDTNDGKRRQVLRFRILEGSGGA